jgi:hypothetical protein
MNDQENIRKILKKHKLILGKTGTCPCQTTPPEVTWDEKQWEKHWADQREGHQKILARLHKEARE